MKRKIFVFFVLVISVFFLVSCDLFSSPTTTTTTITTTTTATTVTTTNTSNVTTDNTTTIITRLDLDIRLLSIYDLAVQAEVFEGTYEEWLETVQGPQGDPGTEVLLQVASGYIQWQYVGETEWTNLVELATLVGPAGADGIDGINGTDGLDGLEVTFQVASGYIQWQYVGDTEWTNLVELATLVGPAGADGIDGIDGTDGLEVTFQVASGYIQWQYVGDTEWTNLVELATLVGPAGADGADGINGIDGADGLEVTFQVASGYIQWQYVGDTEWTNLVELATLVGPAGADGIDGINGTDGTDGTDGLEVTFQVASGYIQWQYVGDTEWVNLVELATLVGPAGADGIDGINGTDGTDGLEVTFQVASGYIQWQYVGDTEWTNLVELATLVGPAGADGIDGINGTDGTDGLEVTFQVASGYIQWQYVGDTEWTNLVELATLVGPAGADGIDGINGTDGLEVTFQVTSGYIQWQYVGDTEWTNLVELATLVGPAGADGIDGTDGLEVIFQVSEGYIQWQYVGDIEWTNLIELTSLTGQTGVGILSTEINIQGELVITYTNDVVVNLGHIVTIFTVSFKDYNGHVLDTQLLEYGSNAVAPNNPTRVGYTFTGWDITFDNVTCNLTVLAVYEIDTYIITFDSNGGTSQIELSDISYGSTIDLAIPSKEGFYFGGWYLGNTINDSQFTSNSIVESNLTLYARWLEEAYSVTFVDYDSTILFTEKVEHGYSANLPSNPTRIGYTFIGWDQSHLVITSDITLVAQYNVNQYTISFVSNEGSAVSDIYQDYDSAVIEPTEPTRLGYTFDAWYGDMELSTAYTFTTMPAEDIMLYAKWTINQYSVTYENYDGTILQTSEFDYHADLSGVTPPTDPTREGHTFAGWDSTLPETLPANDVVITATYTINQYTITYDITPNYDPLTDILLNPGEVISDVNLGYYHSAGITSEGRVFTWGANNNGELGDGTIISSYTPIEITSQFDLNEGEYITSISLGFHHSSALTSEGRLFMWGKNYYGQLGDGTTTYRSIPTEITSQFNLNESETIINVSLSYNYSLAITSEGRVFTWGYNCFGVLGDGTIIDRHTPVEITSQFNLSESETITYVSLGYGFASAITSAERIFTWGWNSEGQLGDGTTSTSYNPLEITSQFNLNEGETIISMSLADEHSSALTSEGRIFTWGDNGYGQLGDGTTINKLVPTEITSEFTLNESETIIDISLGDSHSSALTSEGRMYTWGNNNDGQLGDGTIIRSYSPIEITSQFDLIEGEAITDILLGAANSSAITSDGSVFLWGCNDTGQLGDATIIDKYLPTELTIVNIIIRQIDTYDFASILTAPADPVKDGYTFGGWYNRDFTVLYTFDTMPAEDITLYAKWIGMPDGITYIIVNDEVIITGYTGTETDLVLPETVEEGYPIIQIQENAFRDTNIESIIIPANVLALGDRAFYFVDELTTIIFREGSQLETIGNSVFYYTGLSSIELPSTIISIGDNAFAACYFFTELNVPASLIDLGTGLFRYSSNLMNINVDIDNPMYSSLDGVLFNKSKTELITYPVGKTETSYIIPTGVIVIKASAFAYSQLVDIEIPYTVTTIEREVFFNSMQLVDMIIPSSVTSIGDYVFTACIKLTEYIVDDDNPNYSSLDGVLFNKLQTELIAYPAGKTDTSYQIPNTVEIIKKTAFSNSSYLLSIDIPDSVLIIETEAFSGCTSITEITIPTSVTSIAAYAFSYCVNLAEIRIPINVTVIGPYAFYLCDSLTIYAEPESIPVGWESNWNPESRPVVWGTNDWYKSTISFESNEGPAIDPIIQVEGSVVTVPDPTLDGYTFDGWYLDAEFTTGYEFTVMPVDNITVYEKWIEMPEGLTFSIVDNEATITGYTGTETNLVLAETTLGGYPVTEIGDNAFSNSSIESIVIPANVTRIGNGAFFFSRDLISVTFREGSQLEVIEDNGFYFTHIRSIVLPDTVTSIGVRAFADCRYLTEITIPASVTTIGNRAFFGGIVLTSITVDIDNPMYSSLDGILFNKSKTEIINYPVGKTETSYQIPNTVEIIIDSAFAYSQLVSVEIPNTVTSIEGTAFFCCMYLESIVIPDSVTRIGDYVFTACIKLTEYIVDDDNPNYSSLDGVLFNELQTELIAYPAGKTDTSYQIPNTVEIIKKTAFSNSSYLLSIDIPDSVLIIETEAFSGCTSITEITIPTSVTSIAAYAFSYCVNLAEIRIPINVTVIGPYAFYLCDSLTIYAEPESIPVGWESNWNPESRPVVWGTNDWYKSTISFESNEGPAIDPIIQVEGSVVTVPDPTLDGYTFDGWYLDAEFTTGYEFTVMPVDNITVYEKWIGMPEGLTFSIVDNEATITGYTGTETNLVLAETTLDGYPITEIGDNAFSNSSIESIVIPANVTRIGNSAFYYSLSLISVTFREGSQLEVIEESGFRLTYITSIILPDTLISIGEAAFGNSYNLTEITIPASVTTISDRAFYACFVLTSITVESANQNYSSEAGVLYNKLKTELLYYPKGKVGTTYQTPEGVVSIAAYAFQYTNLVSIDISSTVASIGEHAFFGSNTLTSINVDAANPNYSSIDGVLFNKLQTDLVLYPSAKLDTNYQVPAGVENILEYAFQLSDNLITIELPDSLLTIGHDAFDRTAITGLTIPSNVTSIGDSVFRFCDNLNEIMIPISVIDMGSSAFYDCPNLTIYVEPESIPAGWDSNWNPESIPVVWGYSDWYKSTITLNTDGGTAIPDINQVEGTEVIIPDPTKDGYTFDGWYDRDFIVKYEITTMPADNIELYAKWIGMPEGITFIIVDNEVVITGYTGTETNLVLPETIQAGHPITEIGDSAFSSSSIESIVIPANVTVIRSRAFYFSTDLVSVTFREGSQLEVIEESGFNFTHISSIVLPNTLTSIGEYTFSNCNYLTEIIIPASVTSIGNQIFMASFALTSITVESANLNYSSEAGVLFNKLKTELVYYPIGKVGTTYQIPEGVVSFGTYTFAYSKLVSIDIPSTVASIGVQAFFGSQILASINVDVDNLNYLSIDGVVFNKLQTDLVVYPPAKLGANYQVPAGVENILEYAFQLSDNLITIELPDSLLTIENYAFDRTTITEIIIPPSVISIGSNAFMFCNDLNEAMIPISVVDMGSYVFYSSPNLTIYVEAESIPAGWDSNWNPESRPVVWGTNDWYKSTISFESNEGPAIDPIIQVEGSVVTVPDPTLDGYTFDGWYLDAEFTTGYEFTVMPVDNITVYEKWIGMPEGLTFSIVDNEATITGYTGTETNLVLAETTLDGYPITEIGDNAFSNSSIESIVIPANVTRIGNSAFYYSLSLISVTFREGSQLEVIEESGFRLTYITSIILPDTLISIGEAAFGNSYNLTEITIPASVTTISDRAFYACFVLTSITVESANQNYSSEAGVLYNKLKTELLYYPKGKVGTTYQTPEGVVSIAAYAFQYTNLVSIDISSTVASIGEHAFFGSNTLTSINVDAANPNYSSIDGVLFNKLQTDLVLYPSAKLDTNYQVPAGVENILEYAFQLSDNLITIELPDSLLTIGHDAFDRTAITGLTIPSNVTSIGDSVFRFCDNLNEIMIPISVIDMGSSAFYDCPNLTIYVEAESIPAGWDSNWNPESVPVVWGYTD
ncbi:leucine-rich repeat protein [Mycoplasmatota bacterium WC30]